MNRKKFIKNTLTIGGALTVSPMLIAGNPDADLFGLDEVKEFVFAAHSDFEKTKRIINQKPLLLNCTNQAQRGDFETAIGGASHMGRHDIAQMLLRKGARLDMFSLTFLGYLDHVKDLIQKNPNHLLAPGPHGFTLLHHARVGKHTKFAQWLVDRGLKTEFMKDVYQ